MTLKEWTKQVDEGKIELKEEQKQTGKRGKSSLQRPDKKVVLQALAADHPQLADGKWGHTDDLQSVAYLSELPGVGFIIYCDWSCDCWFAPTELCVNQNFIYREDLECYDLNNPDEHKKAEEVVAKWEDKVGNNPSKKCWVVDFPAQECYEVYNDISVMHNEYGITTPKGAFVNVYQNRFERDAGILYLDQIYSESSKQNAKKLTERAFKQDECIIISDGAWMRESCSSSFWYLDAYEQVHLTSGFLPSDANNGVLISEIRAAHMALKYARSNNKKNIHYYYDNTSILNVFRNKKQEFMDEIRDYKAFVNKLIEDGFHIDFIELHPKTTTDNVNENKALSWYHTDCDNACRDMCEINGRKLKDNATLGGRENAKGPDDIKEMNAKANRGNNKKGGATFQGQGHAFKNKYK